MAGFFSLRRRGGASRLTARTIKASFVQPLGPVLHAASLIGPSQHWAQRDGNDHGFRNRDPSWRTQTRRDEILPCPNYSPQRPRL
jgi:hypothetical protein